MMNVYCYDYFGVIFTFRISRSWLIVFAIKGSQCCEIIKGSNAYLSCLMFSYDGRDILSSLKTENFLLRSYPNQ